MYDTVDSKRLEHGCKILNGGRTSFFVLELADGRVPTLWLLLYVHSKDVPYIPDLSTI